MHLTAMKKSLRKRLSQPGFVVSFCSVILLPFVVILADSSRENKNLTTNAEIIEVRYWRQSVSQ